eukprot:3104373-Rhodomonas_salina.2
MRPVPCDPAHAVQCVVSGCADRGVGRCSWWFNCLGVGLAVFCGGGPNCVILAVPCGSLLVAQLWWSTWCDCVVQHAWSNWVGQHGLTGLVDMVSLGCTSGGARRRAASAGRLHASATPAQEPGPGPNPDSDATCRPILELGTAPSTAPYPTSVPSSVSQMVCGCVSSAREFGCRVCCCGGSNDELTINVAAMRCVVLVVGGNRGCRRFWLSCTRQWKCGAVLRKGAMGVGEDMAAEIFTEINKAEPCKLLDLPQSKVSQMEKVSRSLASLVRVVDVVVVVSFVTRIFIIIQNRL